MARSLRRQAGSFIAEAFFQGAARLGSLHPRARPEVHGVEVLRDVRYAPGEGVFRLLDVYRPSAPTNGLRPAVLYIHGGGFRILSKDTHWVMGIQFARRGYVVFSINYRLAPEHPFPHGLEDCSLAYRWLLENAQHFGADASRLVVAGESAGANLTTALAVAATFRREEPWARAVFDTGVVPRAIVPACGILQVTDTERFARERPNLKRLIADRIEEVGRGYLGERWRDVGDGQLDLADPLCVLERADPSERPFPPAFVPCGTADPLVTDTQRLVRALERRGTRAVESLYPGEHHAFHAFVFRPEAKRCWAETFAFLEEQCPPALRQGAA